MDENEITHEAEELTPRLHDKWSVLVLALNWATNVTMTTAKALGAGTDMALQHAAQKTYDREFNQITKEM
jgi:hypothetical protein